MLVLSKHYYTELWKISPIKTGHGASAPLVDRDRRPCLDLLCHVVASYNIFINVSVAFLVGAYIIYNPCYYVTVKTIIIGIHNLVL